MLNLCINLKVFLPRRAVFLLYEPYLFEEKKKKYIYLQQSYSVSVHLIRDFISKANTVKVALH